MITPKTDSKVFTSGIDETKVFKIKSSGKGFAILTANLYSNKIAAILRELGCNAIDAHKDAGVDKPFTVHLPNQLKPEFFIRDYGTGISEEDMETVYTVLFESTKENTNDAIGCLGLGSKTPFAYTDNFFVTSFQNGIRKVYNIFMDESGTPTYSKVFEGETDEENGLMVKFAVNKDDIWKFHEEASNIYSYFSQKPEIQGAQISYKEFGNPLMQIQGCKIYEGGYYSRNSSRVIMGNIAYPIQEFTDELRSDNKADELIRSFMNAYYFHLEVPIGTFDIVPSREAISFNAVSIANLRKILAKVIKEIGDEVDKKAQEIVDIDEYLLSCYEYNHFLRNLESFHADIIKAKKLSHKSGAPFVDLVAIGSDDYNEMNELVDANKLKQGVRRYTINKPQTARNLTYKTNVNFNIDSFFSGKVEIYSVDLKAEKGIARRIKGYLLDCANDVKDLILVPKELLPTFIKATQIDPSRIKAFDLPAVAINRSASSGARFEDRVTKDSVRVESVIHNSIPNFDISSGSVVTRFNENIFYVQDYSLNRHVDLKEYVEEQFGEDEFCIVYIERSSFIDKIQGWKDNTWIDLKSHMFEYSKTIDQNVIDEYMEKQAIQVVRSVRVPSNNGYKKDLYFDLLTDDAKEFHALIQSKEEYDWSMDEKILFVFSSGFSVNEWPNHLVSHEYFKYISRYSDEKMDKVLKFYLDNCEDAEKISLDAWIGDIEVNRNNVFNGTTYDWKKIVKEYIEKKKSKPVDTKNETVV